MSKALVLDYGGVISKTPFETWPDAERALGLAPGSLTWPGPFNPGEDPEWSAMQAGKMSERDYWALRIGQIGRMVGEEWTEVTQFINRARGNDPMRNTRPEALQAIDATKAAGLKLAILSNELDLFYGREMRMKLTFLDKFDTIIDATYTGILKPDPRAYAKACDALGVAAADCVFVDDQARNVAGAIAVGMQAVHFDVSRPQESYRRALSLLGIA
jgi:putative hydrolase of the HAD superfamily